MGSLRTLDSNRESFETWRDTTDSDRKQLKDFDSCHAHPMPLRKEGSEVVMGKIITFTSIRNM